MRIMKLVIATLMIATIACSAAVAHDTTTREQDLAIELGRVDLKAGITLEQANTIARFYFRAGCGGAAPAVDRGSRWEVTPVIGIAGISDKNPIMIEKHTGTISWKEGSTMNLAAILARKEALPQPIHKGPVTLPRHLPSGARSVTIKVEFVVLPSGATSDFTFRHSSGRRECDGAVMQAVKGWRYAPRKESMTLVESLETCAY